MYPERFEGRKLRWLAVDSEWLDLVGGLGVA
jgi:hypothetical protein